VSTHAVPLTARRQRRGIGRLRSGLATGGAGVLGAAPHVLHHAGPLAGAALLAGAGGTLLFGALGLVLSIPMLRRIRRHTGSWRAPAGVLAAMAVMFTFSALVIGPAVTGDDGAPANPTKPVPAGHDTHHP
jgi:hypothetical protein